MNYGRQCVQNICILFALFLVSVLFKHSPASTYLFGYLFRKYPPIIGQSFY